MTSDDTPDGWTFHEGAFRVYPPHRRGKVPRRTWRIRGRWYETVERVPAEGRIEDITVEDFGQLEEAGEIIRQYRWRT